MSDIGTWSYARSLVREVRIQLEAFESQTQRTEKQLAQALIASQRREFELSLLVSALIDTLAASGHLDVDVLEGRVENMREEQPYSAQNPEPLTAERPYQCAACFRAMTMAEGTMVADGLHCQACMRRR